MFDFGKLAMKKIMIIGVIAIMAAATAFGQVKSFRIMSKTGDVSIKKGSSKKWVSAKVNDVLASGEEIKLADDAFCNLLASNNVVVELKDDGTYTFKKLAEKANKKKKSTSAKLSESVMNDISSSSDFFKKQSLKNKTSLTGAGERAVGGNEDESGTISAMTGADSKTSSAISSVSKVLLSENSKEIGVFSPRNCFILGKKISFYWDKVDDKSSYALKIFDKNDVEVFSATPKNNSLDLEIASTKLQKGMNYFWQVESGDLKSIQYQFKILSDSAAAVIDARAKELAEDFDETPNAFECAMLAEFYANENIQNMSFGYYEKAIAESKGADEYKKLYARHLMTAGLYRQAEDLLKGIGTDSKQK